MMFHKKSCLLKCLNFTFKSHLLTKNLRFLKMQNLCGMETFTQIEMRKVDKSATYYGDSVEIHCVQPKNW